MTNYRGNLLKFNEARNAMVHRNKKNPDQKISELSALVKNALPSSVVPNNTQVMMVALKICFWFIRDIRQSLPPPS